MPVILEPPHWALWLDPACEDRGKLEVLFAQFPAGKMMVRPVGHLVDNPRNEGEQLIIPLEEQA